MKYSFWLKCLSSIELNFLTNELAWATWPSSPTTPLCSLPIFSRTSMAINRFTYCYRFQSPWKSFSRNLWLRRISTGWSWILGASVWRGIERHSHSFERFGCGGLLLFRKPKKEILRRSTFCCFRSSKEGQALAFCNATEPRYCRSRFVACERTTFSFQSSAPWAQRHAAWFFVFNRRTSQRAVNRSCLWGPKTCSWTFLNLKQAFRWWDTLCCTCLLTKVFFR